MNIVNNTNARVPEKWVQRIMDKLHVNPTIYIDYMDNPETTSRTNNTLKINNKTVNAYAVASSDNTIHVFYGEWIDGKFVRWTQNFLRWIIAHELRHHYYNYLCGLPEDPFKGSSEEERIKKEERGCNRFANKEVGVMGKHFSLYERH